MRKGKVRSRSSATRLSMAIEGLEPRTMLAAAKIMPLGDSITEGWSGHTSYRFALYQQLVGAGYDVDFVGNRTGISSGSPLYSNFDQNHQGTSGIRADQVQASIATWATQNPPEIVLLHIGTNDITQGQSNSSTITEIGGIIDNLRTVVANVKILLAKIIPASANTNLYSQLNTSIGTLATDKNTAQSPVIVVDQFTGFSTSADSWDGVHPDDSGERKMAAKWFTALQGILPAPTPPPPVTYVSDLTPTQATNGWGPVEKDMSNAEQASGDGRILGLNTIGYLKGLGVHANSDVRYNLGGNYSEFRADIGVDDESGANGQVVFQVYVDNVLRYTSPSMTAITTTQSVVVNVAGAAALRLVVNDGGDASYDHADWANARLIQGTVPNAPTNLNAAVVGQQINLTWNDNATTETGYRVERKTGSGGTYVTLIELAANATGHNDTTATPGQQYFYRVMALGSTGNSGFSNEDDATVPVAAPSAPTNLDANVSGQQINLTWTDNASNETSYRVDRKQGAGGTWAQLIQLAANATSHSDTTATAGLAYYYRVYAHNSGGPSGFSNEDNATIPLPPVPAAPTGLGANAAAGQISLGWIDNASTETGYRVERKTGVGGTWGLLINLGANANSHNDTTVQAATTYYYRVFATNAGGDSLASNEANATTPSTVFVSDLPYVVVTNGWGPVEKDRSNGETGATDGNPIRLNTVQYTKGLGTHARSDITVNLGGQYAQFLSDIGVDDESGNNGSVVFQVYLNGVLSYDSGTMTGTTATRQINLNVLGKTTMRLLVTDAGNGNAHDHADWANARLVLGTPVPVPNQPSGLNASLNGTNVDLTWTDGSTDETGFRVERKLGVGGTWGAVQTLGANSTGWTDTGPLNPNTTYYYRVFAFNIGGDSLPSTEANVTTAPIPVPAAPSNLNASYNSGTSRVDLTWADNSGTETGFRIERKLGAGGTWAAVTTVSANVLSYSDSGPFQANSNYFYRVFAFNVGGDSASPSNEDDITTPVAPAQTWLSDLNWVSATNGWGAVEKDRSNGELGSTDGRTITLNGVTYAKGLGVHSNSSILYNLNGQYTTFQSDIGVDDESGSNGTVVFQVFVNDVKVFDSGVMNGSSATQSINLNVAGATTLRLVVINGGDSFDFDHADWAGAKLLS